MKFISIDDEADEEGFHNAVIDLSDEEYATCLEVGAHFLDGTDEEKVQEAILYLITLGIIQDA